ncbi:MAG: subtilisin-like proprotein convertase family protein [Saprospiraceae bacterium]|jgi:subtilisin-like proprotein convertase family protein
MKNGVPTFLTMINKTTRLLTIVLLALVSYSAQADITNPTATVTGGYYPGSTSTIIVDVSFGSNSAEGADMIEVRLVGPVAGLSLWHSSPSPSPYIGCGLDKGDEVMVSGPAWTRPGFTNGNSQCGAFTAGTHSFGIDVTASNAVSGSFGIEVRIVGDGLGETEATIVIADATVQEITCVIMCPDPVVLNAPNGSCSANANVPSPIVTGMCSNTSPAVSGNFPVGTTNVTYTSEDDNGIVISCTTMVIIVDDEDPIVSGVTDLTADLAAGECGYIIPQTFAVNENCIEPQVTITQNEDLGTFEEGVNCPGGPTKYLRVFDTNAQGINTELNIEEVTFGVAEAFGSPSVTVNVYILNGPLSYSNMELVGTGNEVLPNFQNGLYSIPVSAIVEAGEEFVVEIVVPGSQFNGVIIAMNNNGQTAPSYIASDFCGAPEPVTLDLFNYGEYGSIMIVEGFQTSFIVQPVGNTALIGDEAPEGVTQVTYEAIDASGNSTAINFTVTVTGFEGAISAIVCNDEVQISLDEECMEIVAADLILEGGPYSCYDEYTVEIKDDNGNSYGNIVTGDNIGQNLTVRVTGPNNNSCWGKLVVEDKAPALLDCIDVTTTCFGEIFPGSPIAERVTFPANIDQFNAVISDGPPNSNDLTFPVKGLVKSTITGVSVRVNIEHDSISELTATLTAPDGTSAVLFVQPGFGCTVPNLQITLDDNAFNSYGDLLNACSDIAPAISGIYQPNQFLSIFNGKDPNGDWTITISDLENGTGGTVIAAELVISQTGGIVTFPTENDVIAQTEGANTYTVIGIDGCGPTTMSYYDDEIDQDCSSPYSNVIRRTWSAVDASGNVSNSCVQTIYIFRNGLATLMFPPNYDDLQEPSLSCELFANDAPGTDVTGAPSGELCDNVQIFPYTDTKIDVCEGSYKLIRHFRLLEWCSGEVIEHNQIIKVLDKEGPLMEDIPDITISAGEFDCAADYVFVYPEVVSDCSDEFTYTLSYLSAYDMGGPPTDVPYYSDNTSYTANAALVKDLSFGRTWAKWQIEDECGNVTTEYFTITVDDQVNPIAVCDEFTVVSIGSNGFVDVFATTFDDGSLDNCGILEMRARKMTNDCPGVNTTFGDRVTFCCSEVGETIMVAFEVTDLSGNKNTCMVEVKVQDKLPPYITLCPEDITLNCQADFSDPTVTGEPEYIDNCEVVSVTFIDDENIDNCGAGEVRRTWTVEDKEGFKATCVQTITLEDEDPFEENDIDWPNDYDATTCDTNLDPDNLPVANAYPRYDDDNCSLVATVYEDRVFTFVDGACEKILREWTVIDWCTYNESAPIEGEGYYKHLQVIKLKNTEAPVINNCADVTLDVFGDCEGPIAFSLGATDDCTPTDDIVYYYQIDLFDDGLTAIDFNLKGNSATITSTLPIGVHSVKWTVEDKCGNTTICDMILTVRDGKKPTPYCLSSITTVVMNNNGMIAIWANDFDLGSYDNCTAQSDLLLSFSQNTADNSTVFTCDNLPNGVEEEIQIELWVTDEAGNQEFCSVTLILQDSQDDACVGSTGNFANISGTLRTETFANVEGVSLTAANPILEVFKSTTTNSDGTYNITQLPKGSGYSVIAEKNDDVTNGVSTLDLVMIQRHILGLQTLDSPYKLIAADVNNDGKLKSSDLLTLRKVILGVNTQFPNGQKSWRFVPKNTIFSDATDPFPFNEEINIGDLQYASLNNDMMSIKIGDVNGNVVANLSSDSQVKKRADKNMSFVIEDAKAEDGIVSIPVYAEGIKTMVGYQFSMNLENADYVSVEAGQLEVSNDNFGINGNELTTSWSDASGVSVNTTEPLFTITLDVNDDSRISEILSFNSDAISPEAYDNSLKTYNVILETRSGDLEEGEFALFQNRPNPFLESTQIKFFLPEATDVELIITDVTGRLVTKKTQNYPAGTQNIEINYSDLNVSGVLYYTIKAGEFTATKKMISVR